jgi:RimJ/RimL family protein N-acetyltransferase
MAREWVRWTCHMLIERGYASRAVVDVRADNERAISAYERAGFRKVRSCRRMTTARPRSRMHGSWSSRRRTSRTRTWMHRHHEGGTPPGRQGLASAAGSNCHDTRDPP